MRGRRFSNHVAREIRRRARRRERPESPWRGLGTVGMVGWSIGGPMLLGALAGRWLDAHHPMRFNWTLTLLFAGLVLGCLAAANWVREERRELDEP